MALKAWWGNHTAAKSDSRIPGEGVRLQQRPVLHAEPPRDVRVQALPHAPQQRGELPRPHSGCGSRVPFKFRSSVVLAFNGDTFCVVRLLCWHDWEFGFPEFIQSCTHTNGVIVYLTGTRPPRTCAAVDRSHPHELNGSNECPHIRFFLTWRIRRSFPQTPF